MKDAYSFDADYEGLDKSYQAMYDAYTKAFADCGLDVKAVEADNGAMGGEGSHEFMVIADVGEDHVAFCNKCDYAANIEKAAAGIKRQQEESLKDIEKVYTPKQKTIDEISSFEYDKAKTIKPVFWLTRVCSCNVMGNDQLNEVKLLNYLMVKKLFS